MTSDASPAMEIAFDSSTVHLDAIQKNRLCRGSADDGQHLCLGW